MDAICAHRVCHTAAADCLVGAVTRFTRPAPLDFNRQRTTDARSRRPRRASASQRRSWGSPVALVVIPTPWVCGRPPTRLRGATGGSLCRCSFGRCGSHSAGQHSSPEWRLRRLQRQRRSAAGSPSVRMLAQPHSRACRLAPGGPLQARCWWPVRLGPTGLPGNPRPLLSFHFILALLSKFCFTCSPL